MAQNISVERILTSGLVNWYPWKNGSSIHFVGDCTDEFKQDILCRGVIEGEEAPYDYIVAIRVIERADNPTGMLTKLKRELKEEGHLFLACDNRMGLQYFSGDYDIYTKQVMEGIENYSAMTKQNRILGNGRCYARYEIEHFIKTAGFKAFQGYSILPGLMMPQQIYSWDYLPEEDLEIRFTPLYNNPKTIFLDASKVYNSLIKNDMFHQMANAYLIDCSCKNDFFNVKHITTSMDRGHDNAIATLICDECVYKFALFPEGNLRINKLLENSNQLKNRNILIVPVQKNNGRYYNGKELMGCTMPYIKAPTAMQYLRTLIYKNKESFIEKTNLFLDTILKSANENTEFSNDELAPIYDCTYIDLVPLNCFYLDDRFIFFDQEFCEKNYPIGVVLIRALDIIYMGDKRMEEIVPSSYFIEKYGLNKKSSMYRVMGDKYIKNLRNREKLFSYNKMHLVDNARMNINRQRLNYSETEYYNIFIDLMANIDNKKIFVFGSGNWAQKFIAEYGDRVNIQALLDNDKSKRGTFVAGVKIEQPDILSNIEPDTYKIFICIKQYEAVLAQLKALGAKNYGIYNPYIDRSIAASNDIACSLGKNQHEVEVMETHKKYHLGYVAGVFDLFHVGHLNLLRRAKEQCDILIVGVVSDEQASTGKAHAPYVEEQERLEIVKSCRYVDKAFILPIAASGTRDVFRKYHFDVQFSGSDYEHDVAWLAEQAWLRERGADLVFFPYTQSTSSTKLKAAIENENTFL